MTITRNPHQVKDTIKEKRRECVFYITYDCIYYSFFSLPSTATSNLFHQDRNGYKRSSIKKKSNKKSKITSQIRFQRIDNRVNETLICAKREWFLSHKSVYFFQAQFQKKNDAARLYSCHFNGVYTDIGKESHWYSWQRWVFDV